MSKPKDVLSHAVSEGQPKGFYYVSTGGMPEATRRQVPLDEWIRDMSTRRDGPQMPQYIADLVVSKG